jgi:GT2 family glycosyltransferase
MPRRDAPYLTALPTPDQPPSAGPGISVVICAYTEDRWDDLLAAIQSVQQQRQPAHELTVVVDHNALLFRRLRRALPDVTVIESTGQPGLSGARNSGVAASTGAVIAFLDDDATADPDWLARLSDAYTVDGRDDHQVIGVGGTITPYWEDGRPAWFPEEFDWVVGCTYRGMASSAAPVRNLIGCNMSFRREVFGAIGGFSGGLGRIGKKLNSCEETELCIRARQRFPGSVLVHEPRARVSHRVPASRGRWHYFRARCLAEGRSKALVSSIAGSDVALSSERAYTLHTLPRGAVRGLVDVVARGDVSGAYRAGAIAAGLAITVTGYLATVMADWSARMLRFGGDQALAHASQALVHGPTGSGQIQRQ